MSGAEAFYEDKLDRRWQKQAEPVTNLWTVTFAHRPLWDQFQRWLNERGLCTWVLGREEDELSHGIRFVGPLVDDSTTPAGLQTDETSTGEAS